MPSVASLVPVAAGGDKGATSRTVFRAPGRRRSVVAEAPARQGASVDGWLIRVVPAMPVRGGSTPPAREIPAMPEPDSLGRGVTR